MKQIIVVFVGLVFFMLVCNACTASDWNDGECPKCHERYELVGVSRYKKYYACDSCGKEVARW
jgi:hypothetical protein